MQPLLMLALFLICAILVVWLVSIALNAAKVGEPTRSIILVLLLLGIVVFFARYLGVF